MCPESSATTASRIATICGWRSLPASEASFWNCARYTVPNWTSRNTSGSMVLSATSRPVNWSRARYTVPVAPRPSSLWMSYLPTCKLRSMATREFITMPCLSVWALLLVPALAGAQVTTQEYPLPKGLGAHDVWADPAPGGPVWFSAQRSGQLGILDPATGKVETVPLGRGSAPHGVIAAADGAPWLTDSGQNAIVRVDPKTHAVKLWPLPEGRDYANLNTAIFDRQGVHWFTGQSGVYGRLDPKSGEMKVFDAPKGRGPYGIHVTPQGVVYYASLAGSHIARIDGATGAATVIEPPTREQGARRVWSDSKGALWVAEWHSG